MACVNINLFLFLVHTVKWNSDGRKLASGSNDKTVINFLNILAEDSFILNFLIRLLCSHSIVNGLQKKRHSTATQGLSINLLGIHQILTSLQQLVEIRLFVFGTQDLTKQFRPSTQRAKT